MNKNLEWNVEKKEYVVPKVELYRLDVTDVVCTSPNEGNDNDFDAGDLGSF